MPEFVTTERHGKRAELALNRPDKRNALIVPMIDEMIAAIREFSEDDGVTVILVRGEGGTFCAGMDLEARRADPPPEWVGRQAETWAGYHSTVWDCPKPVVGAVERAAVAGGSALAFSCDYIVTGETARIGATEVRLGIPAAPSNVAWLLARFGYGRALQVAQSAKLFSGRELYEMGLAFKCVPDADVLTEARALADELAQNPLPAMTTMKRTIQRVSGLDFHGMLKQAHSR